jgi:hypothetical protein
MIGASILIVPTAVAADDAGRDAVRRFGGCLAGKSSGHLLLLLDTSSSLQKSDPEGQRIKAAEYLVSELANFVDQSGSKLEVSVAGFADKFKVAMPWTALDGSSSARVRDAIDAFQHENSGFETDYWNALNGARTYLAQRAASGDCTALVWLSDGSYDLDQRDTAAEKDKYGTTKPYGPRVALVDSSAEKRLEQAGAADLCRQGGVADALRIDGVTTLAIGLQGGLNAADFNLMKGVATGTPFDGQPCGAQDGKKFGAFVLADDVVSLFFAFDEIVDPNHLPSTTETKFCQGRVCPDYYHQFVLDPSITSVRILGGSELTRYFAVLISPSGKQVRLDPGKPIKADFPAFSVAGVWRTDSVFSLTLDRKADGGWTGVWRMVFVDPASTDRGTAQSNIRLYGDLEPTWRSAKTELVVGEKPTLQFGLQRHDGSAVDPSLIAGRLSLGADLEYPDGTTLPIAAELDAADLTRPVELDLSKAQSGSATVHLTLRLTTAASGKIPGTTLEPQATDYPVTVATPPSYPKVGATLDFGSGDNADPVTATLPVEGTGCVWLAKSETLTLPDGVKSAALATDASNESSCASGTLPVTLKPSAVGSGLLSGSIQVMTKPRSGSGEPVSVTVAYRYEMQRPADPGVRWAAFVALLLGGVLMPLLLLLWVKRWTAKIPGAALSVISMKGAVDDGTSFLSMTEPDLSTMRTMSLDGVDRRVMPLSSWATLRAKPRLRNLTAPGHVVIEGAPAITSAGNALPLAVQDHWVAVLDPADPGRGQVEFHFLLAPGAAKLRDLLADARANVPAAVVQRRLGLGVSAGPSVNAGSRGARADSGPERSGGSSDQW